MKKTIALLLVLMLVLSGCSGNQSTNLMETYQPNTVTINADTQAGAAAAADFGVRLFQHSVRAGGNTLISPLSVLSALAMTANGADGNTLAQMEQVLGADTEMLNQFLHMYMQTLPDNDKCRLSLANAIWFKDTPSFTVNPIFLQTNADFYGAGVYKSAFDDQTCADINSWVKENTDGMIKDILDKIPEDAVMYLVNALAFDAQWQEIYKESGIIDREFTMEDGTVRNVEMMHSQERYYLENENATGFIKYYEGGKCAFVALLPREGLSLEDYVSTLSGGELLALLENPTIITVNAGIPKFEMAYSVEMSQILKAMGMTDAFDWSEADFSRLGSSTEGNLVIDRVLHKTFIALDEKGTKAGASTAVEVTTECAADPEQERTVILNRPFVYLLIDCETNLPFFLGTMTDPEQTEYAAQVSETQPGLQDQSGEAGDPYAAEPPILLVTDGKQEIQGLGGNYNWEFRMPNGEWTSVIACGLHPLQTGDLLTPLVTEQGTVELNFGRKPSSVTVNCWSDAHLDDPEATARTAQVSGSTLTLREGGWIYEIVATWTGGEQGSNGTASFVVYIVSGT